MTPEGLKEFNNWLLRDFGYFDGGKPRYKLVWSEDEIEKVLSQYTREGFELLTPQIIEKYKYRQWIHERYVLEKLVAVPESHLEVSVYPMSYEPIYTFQNKNGDYLEPHYGATRFLINYLENPKKFYTQYKASNEEEHRKAIQEINEIEDYLFGNESKVTDALRNDSAVGYGVRNRNDSFDAQEKLNNAIKQLGE